MSEIDQQFIEYVVKSLVNKPDEVKIDRRIDEKGVLLELTVDPEDLGRVIGKRGATAQSLRTLLRALGTKNDARYNLKIVDNGVGGPTRAPREDRGSSDNQTDAADSQDSSATDNGTPDDADEIAQEETTQESIPSENEVAEQDKNDSTSDRLAKTRAELADLDDLDL